jgi:ribonuclease T2
MAQAQAYQCDLPAHLPRPRAEGPTPREPRRLLPIGGYTLALIWHPQACRSGSPNVDPAFACRGANRFGFTLHGLWPDGKGREWPQYCAPAPSLPVAVLRRTLCATPSAKLLQHEYAKHGTCMAGSADAYFARSTGLYRRLRYPDMGALASRRELTVGQFVTAFAHANRGMAANMLRVTTDRDGWLDEVRLCLDLRLRHTACSASQDAAPPNRRLRVVPPGA